MTFKDHFSIGAHDYRKFRPGYPESLFSYLASLCAAQDLAWDCATGSGQAAVSLAEYFSFVIATDASAEQIASATQKEGVSYRVALAERSGIAAGSVDLITVAQALHWFDIGVFASEAERVLKEDAILAAWTYGLLSVNEKFDDVVKYLYSDILGVFWPFERQLVESGYAEIEMPFSEISPPPLVMSEQWRFADVIGYLNTWSAVRAYERAHGSNPLERVYDDMLGAWGAPDDVHQTEWPLKLRVWQKSPQFSINSFAI